VRKIKVTGGFHRSRSIEILEHTEARYTPAKVKQAIFNIIGDVTGKTVLDLFAGSGAFSIEALSRGASHATLVEKNPEMCALIRRNLDSLSLGEKGEVLNMEVSRALPFLYKLGAKYDIIFMDPPYNKGYVSETATLLKDMEVHGQHALFVVEHSKREECTAAGDAENGGPPTRRYGETCLTIYELHPETTTRSP
jgi:16S rRNA (guanine966-N2)-methyltransferase